MTAPAAKASKARTESLTLSSPWGWSLRPPSPSCPKALNQRVKNSYVDTWVKAHSNSMVICSTGLVPYVSKFHCSFQRSASVETWLPSLVTHFIQCLPAFCWSCGSGSKYLFCASPVKRRNPSVAVQAWEGENGPPVSSWVGGAGGPHCAQLVLLQCTCS